MSKPNIVKELEAALTRRNAELREARSALASLRLAHHRAIADLDRAVDLHVGAEADQLAALATLIAFVDDVAHNRPCVTDAHNHGDDCISCEARDVYNLTSRYTKIESLPNGDGTSSLYASDARALAMTVVKP